MIMKKLDDEEMVIETANLLQISEYDVFINGFAEWNWPESPHSLSYIVNPFFIRYILTSYVPMQVRSYCRQQITARRIEEDANTKSNRMQTRCVQGRMP